MSGGGGLFIPYDTQRDLGVFCKNLYWLLVRMRFSVNNGQFIPSHGKKYEVLYEIITENWVLNCKTGIMKKIIYILFGMLAWWSCEDENFLIGPEESFSEYTDSRDGKIYRCVTIGDQTWMAENLVSVCL